MSDDPKWLEWRRGGITATEVADAANGTYGGAYGVVARKLGLITVEQNAAMQRGHDWQPRIADAVHALTGLFVVGEETWCQNSDDPMIRATVDGFVSPVDTASFADCVGVLEVKTRGKGVRPNRDRWADQVQWQLLAAGLERGILAEAVIDDAADPADSVCDALYLSEIEADPFRQELLLSLAVDLWASFQMGELPEPSDPSALDDVKAVHGGVPDGDKVDLSDLAEEVERFHRIKAAVKEVSDERDLLEARIREAIGDAPGGTSDRFAVTVSKPRQVMTAELEAQLLAARPDLGVHQIVLDKALVKKQEPDLYDAHRAPIGARTLTIKELT